MKSASPRPVDAFKPQRSLTFLCPDDIFANHTTLALNDPLNFMRLFSIVRLLNTPSIQATNPP